MKNTHDNKSDDAWDDRLGLQSISIRLQKNLIDSLKKLAEADGIGYQPYVRQILTRHVRQLEHDRREKMKKERDILSAR